MCQCLPCLAAHITDHSADADKDMCWCQVLIQADVHQHPDWCPELRSLMYG